QVIEAVLVALWEEAGHRIEVPFTRMPWADAMERYGSDKPDLRYGYGIEDLTRGLSEDAAPFLGEAVHEGGRLRGIRVPGGNVLSRKDLDTLAARVKEAGAGGLFWARRVESGWEGGGVKALGAGFFAGLEAEVGTLLLAVAGRDHLTSPALHAVRSGLIRRLAPAPLAAHAFLWVVDFPLFEPDPVTG